MSKEQFADKNKYIGTGDFVDMYLNGESNYERGLFYPSIPNTIYNPNIDEKLVEDYITNSNRGVHPVTPPRCAWEVASAWSNYLYGIRYQYGGQGCWPEKAWTIGDEVRQQVIVTQGGYDDYYSEPCVTWYPGTGNFHRYTNIGGYKPHEPEEKAVHYLPPSLITYRGWASCEGWHGYKNSQTDWEQLMGLDTGNFEESYGNYHMSHGHFWWGFSQVCDTGDFHPISEGGINATCNTSCQGWAHTVMNIPDCFGLNQQQTGRMSQAIVWLGPSDLDTDTRFNNAIQKLLVDSITISGLREFGEIVNKAKVGTSWCMNKLYIPASNPEVNPPADTYADYFYHMVYNPLGDPSLPIWTGKPRKIRVSMDDLIQPSLWGRWKMRPRHWYDEATDTGQNHMSDEIPLSISLGENRDVFLDPVCETSGEPLVGANVTLVYEAAVEQEGLDHVYDSEFGVETQNNNQFLRMPRKNYHPYLLRYTTVDESGLATFINWADSETWIEGVGEVQLQVGDYIKAYINTETRRHGLPYEQKVITFRLTE